MAPTIPQPPRPSRHLRVVDGMPPTAGSPRLTGASPPEPDPLRPVLSRTASLRLEQAECFLLSLDAEDLSAYGGLRAAYLLGLAELHLAGMIELIRLVVTG